MIKKLEAGEIARLKGQGFILQRDKEHFVCRIVTVNGCLQPQQSKKLADIAEKYGAGYISFTTRLSVEIPGIVYENIENVRKELEEVQLYSGGTGPKVRPIVSCKGTVCGYGLLDTQKLNAQIHKKFYEGWRSINLPHKFKIGIGGCPNNCIKPNLNDIGIMGQRKPKIDSDLCAGCKKCSIESVCKAKAAKPVNGKINIDFTKCRSCGSCIGKCHFNAVKLDKDGVKIFIGGRWGKEYKIGEAINRIFTIEEAFNFIEKALLYYKENGMSKERFGQLIDRVGFQAIQETLLSDKILDRKEEILCK